MRTKQICPHCGAVLPKKGPEEFPKRRRDPVPWAWQCPDCRGFLTPVDRKAAANRTGVISALLVIVLASGGLVLPALLPSLFGRGKPGTLLYYLLAVILCLLLGIARQKDRRGAKHQIWRALLASDVPPYFYDLHRKPTHTAHFRADAPLFEQDILQVQGTETYLLLRRITGDTVDFCTVPYSESPALPKTAVLSDGESSIAALTDIQAYCDMQQP